MKTIKQISVFLENRQGTLSSILNVLKNEKIEIQAAAVSDTSDYGILRLITSEQRKAADILNKNGILANVNEVLAIKIGSDTADFALAVDSLTNGGVQINYLYTFHVENMLVLIIRPDNLEKAVAVAEKNGLELVKGWE